MKANELMIGDWVQVPCLIDNVEHYDAWCKVKQLRDCDLDVIGFKELKYNEIMPIPLTAEILEKNFTAIPNTFWSSVDYFYHNSSHTVKICRYIGDGTWKITYGEDTIGGKSEWRMYATYVHELQHALRLCGVDKEIEL